MSNKHKTGGEDDSFQKVLTNPESTLTEKYVALAGKYNILVDSWTLQRDKIVELQAEIKSEREKLAIAVEANAQHEQFLKEIIKDASMDAKRNAVWGPDALVNVCVDIDDHLKRVSAPKIKESK